MEISIGVRDTTRGEIALDVDQSADEVAQAVAEALNSNSLLTLTDKEGKRAIVPASAIAYVQIHDVPERKVGFGF